MPKGAPKGNQYARKEPSQKRDGSTMSLYISGYDMELLQMACQLEGIEPTRENAIKRAKELAKKAIFADIRRTFADPRVPEILRISET